MKTITLRSRILSGLFMFVVGHPSSLKMPDDFAYIPADRALPPPHALSHERKVKRIYVDNVRRLVTQKVGVMMMVIALLVTGVSLMLNGAIQGAGHLLHTTGTGASSPGWFHRKPALSEVEQNQLNTFLAHADLQSCQRMNQQRITIQTSHPDQTMPAVLDAVIQGCHDKFGDAVDAN